MADDRDRRGSVNRGQPSLAKSRRLGVALLLLVACVPGLAEAQDDAELAKKTQNPVADLISVPFQNNVNFGVGPNDDVQYILNVQPVIPFRLTENWNLISRTIVPLIYQPELAPGVGDVFGLGDIQQSLFFSPAKPGKLIWGVGPILQFPTATDDSLGQGKWGAGPTAVALTVHGPWVLGALINNVWSFAGDSDRRDVNQMLIQPFVNYNLPDAWYVVTAPIITADWEAESDDRWTVPIGAGVGKIVRIGKLPVNAQASAYYNVVRPDNAAEWQLRIQSPAAVPEMTAGSARAHGRSDAATGRRRWRRAVHGPVHHTDARRDARVSAREAVRGPATVGSPGSASTLVDKEVVVRSPDAPIVRSVLICLAVLAVVVAGGVAAGAGPAGKAQHLVHRVGRHRLRGSRALRGRRGARHADAQHRPARHRGHDPLLLLRAAELHAGARGDADRAHSQSQRHDDRGLPGPGRRPAGGGVDPRVGAEAGRLPDVLHREVAPGRGGLRASERAGLRRDEARRPLPPERLHLRRSDLVPRHGPGAPRVLREGDPGIAVGRRRATRRRRTSRSTGSTSTRPPRASSASRTSTATSRRRRWSSWIRRRPSRTSRSSST